MTYRTFWLFVSSYALLFFMIIGTLEKLTTRLRTNVEQASGIDFLMYPMVWQTISWLGSWLFLFLGMLIILLVTNEIECQTFRQHIIDGISHTQYIIAKYMVIVCLCIYATGVMVILCMIYGNTSPSMPDGSWIYAVSYMFAFCLQGVGFLSITFLFAIWFKRSLIATVVLSIWGSVIEPFIGWFLNNAVGYDISSWLPFHVISGIILCPFQLTNIELSLPQFNMLLCTMVYICIMIFAIWMKIRYSDQ